MYLSFKHIKFRTVKVVLYTFVLQLLSITQLVCQNNITESKIDSFSLDSTQKTEILPFDTVDINIKDDDIKSPVHYKALDSIVYDVANKMLYLYGNAEMKYDDAKINSDNVAFDWNTQTLSAEGTDSAGKNVHTPVLEQDGKIYEANKMEYNFRTSKGKIYDVVTEENGAFIHSEVVVKTDDDSWFSKNARYTTCTDKEHPHFYIQTKKAKIIPDKIMVSGPANLIISGINTPLALPFAIFPISKGRHSGLIIPRFGTDRNDGGYYFKDGGYYWAVNDFLSVGFKGTISTGGSYGVRIESDYKKMYKYSGDLSFDFAKKMPRDPIAFKNSIKNDYLIKWKHSMDSKANPNNKFYANVNYETSSFNKNALVQDERILKVINSSNITYQRLFAGKPYNLTISANHNQNSKTHKFSITLPQVAFNVSKITPFKPKVSSKNKKFYEKIGFTYNIKGKAVASAPDTTFFTKKTFDEINYGITQKININASYSVFKYFNFTPRFDYNEQWFFRKENQFFEQHYVYQSDTISDTLYTKSLQEDGFYARRNFSTGASFNTTLKGIYRFTKGPVKAMQHILTPSVSYNYKPDFSLPNWKYYDSYYNEKDNKKISYNQFNKYSVYGTGVRPGEQNLVSLALQNSLEIKVLDKKDTANMYKKIPILKSFRIASGYNFSGDSINKYQNVRISTSTSFLNNLFNISGTLLYNPYSVDENNNIISKMYLETDNKLLRFNSFNANIGFTLRSKKKGKKKPLNTEFGYIEENEYLTNNPDLYYDFDIPWSFNASYHLNLTHGFGTNRDTIVLGIGSVVFGGRIDITPKWEIIVNSGYDLKSKDLTITRFTMVRDLHCWEMNLNWTAYPLSSQNYSFVLKVKSTVLQDLKLKKNYHNYNSSF